jgi:hypothetical protein
MNPTVLRAIMDARFAASSTLDRQTAEEWRRVADILETHSDPVRHWGERIIAAMIGAAIGVSAVILAIGI